MKLKDKVAEEIGGGAVAADVSVEADVINLVNETESRFGRIDLFCSNAGGHHHHGQLRSVAERNAASTNAFCGCLEGERICEGELGS